MLSLYIYIYSDLRKVNLFSVHDVFKCILLLLLPVDFEWLNVSIYCKLEGGLTLTGDLEDNNITESPTNTCHIQ